MPFAFSTLGCPDASLTEVLALAQEYGAGGLELRAGAGQLVHRDLAREERQDVRAALAASGVTALAVSSYVKICAAGDDAAVVADLSAQLHLAHDIGAEGVRVFPGALNARAAAADRRAVRRLTAAAPLARRLGVRIYLETHDSHPRGQDVARILGAMDASVPGHPVQVIWDVLHPWRAGETPEETVAAIRPWLAYVQIKDALAAPPGSLTLVGQGDVPLEEIAGLFVDRPELWVSLEWEKPWSPELPELPLALGAAHGWYLKFRGPDTTAGNSFDNRS